ncbi:hypothetical protein GCM10023195_80500 [Actinoallomurus liliacearum]|uniref:Uncharacterized protein n=1 Tax=Actinoallomurus liliacearum TaxID=1080073 RepID=A0ABP8TWA2_9ACTN
MDLPTKIAAFCRELGEGRLLEISRRQQVEEVFRAAEEALRSGRIGPELEADLDQLDQVVAQVEGLGLYPAPLRAYQPLPGPVRQTGARWWTCPLVQCAGRGRVRPGQQAPTCAAAGRPLVAGPLPG